MCNGTFEDKDPHKAMKYLVLLAENAQNQDTTSSYEAPSKTQPHTSSGGMYNLREDHEECRTIRDKLELMRNIVPTNENKRTQRAWRVNTIYS